MQSERFTAWITKYALTQGIFSVDARRCDVSTMIAYKRSGDTFDQYAHGNDWHRTPEAALARAEQMRGDRIASLRSSLAKLEAMGFSAGVTP